MFQRFKGFNLDNFLDGKIAEEQARQAKAPQSPSGGKRTPNNGGLARRGSGRTDSPSKRTSSRLRAEGAASSKGPDPEEFVIGDDASDISRAVTPRPVKEGVADEERQDGDGQDGISQADKGKERVEEVELPEDVRKKLARLETLSAKYQDLLRNYRTAHARVSTIDPFEATLREHTPLASISDPGALVEFLNQRSIQNEMVLEELKRVAGEHKNVLKERDELKAKLESVEQRAPESSLEGTSAENFKQQEDAATATNTVVPQAADEVAQAATSTSVAAKTETSEGDDFFSYETEKQKGLEEQVKEHEAEIKQQHAYINELSTENATLRQDLDMCQLELSAMQNKVTVKDREITGMQSELQTTKSELQSTKSELQSVTSASDAAKATSNSQGIIKELADTKAALEEAAKAREAAQAQEQDTADLMVQTEAQMVALQEKLKQYQQSLVEREQELKEKAAAAEDNLKKYQAEHDENLRKGKYAQREEKGMETLRNLVNTLREQAKQAGEAKERAEGKVNDLQFEIKRLEAEIASSSGIIAELRRYEATAESLKKKLANAETERDSAQKLADSKKGHEAAVASLRSQLKRAENDRDAAYQMILDCGKCSLPGKDDEKPPATPTEVSSTPSSRSRGDSEVTEHTELSTQPTEASTATASVDGDTAIGEAKKKNKKKKPKAKKKTPEEVDSLSVEELVANPVKAKELLQKHGDPNNMIKFLTHSVETMKAERETRDGELDQNREHLENTILTLQATIKEKDRLIEEKDEQIQMVQIQLGLTTETLGVAQSDDRAHANLQAILEACREVTDRDDVIEKLEQKLKGEEGLQEEIETLRESLVDYGGELTDAKDAAKTAREQKAKLQEEFDKLQVESDRTRKLLKDAESKRNNLSEKCNVLEAKIFQMVDSHKLMNLEDELEDVQKRLWVLTREKINLEVDKEASLKEMEELKAHHAASNAESEQKHRTLSTDFSTLQTRMVTMETDLTAANQLAQARYKDLTDVREQLNRLLPELKKLREDAAELKIVKTDLEKSYASVRRLEAKEKDLRSEIAEYKSQAAQKDSELSSLRGSARQSDERSTALEDSYENARKDLEKSQSTRNEAIESRDKLSTDLKNVERDLTASITSLAELEARVKTFSDEASSLREELQMKSAQHSSAQSLMDSMRDQTRELATQMKEVRERNESLDEELADAHRLLSERSREGDTMRRMLADVEASADSRCKEMRERLELAIEERDRAEEEASTVGRRKTKELSNVEARLRDAEHESKRAIDAREDAMRREGELKSKLEDLERSTSRATGELTELRAAMSQLRDTLEESERQSQTLEKEKAELRTAMEEREARLEKLQKSSRAMAEELRGTPMTNKLRQGSVQSSRSSVESSRIASPISRTSNGAPFGALNGSSAKDNIDYIYLKNVLLQFLEQRDKRHQMQLVPVLGMLLHFDKQDEQKWMTVISAR